MKILFLSQRFLLPADTGGKIRTSKLLEQLTKENDITLVSNFEYSKDSPHLPQMDQYCSRFIPVPWKEITRYSTRFLLRLAIQTLSRYPITALNSYSRSLRTALETECSQNDYDLVICDFVQSAPSFKNIKDIPSIVFQHNVESVIAKRHVEQAINPLTKVFWWLQWKKLSAFEAKQCRTFDKVIAVSENDRETFKCLYGLDNVVTIPTGVDTTYYSTNIDQPEVERSLVFCGSMDWLPNEDGVLFFINEILPILHDKINDISLTVVGRSPSARLLRLTSHYPEVEFTGWVADTRPYVAKSSLVIVPLRIGGGTRMKIYEAMAMGKTVVSTSIGAEGLDVIHGVNIAIANDPITFSSCIISLIKDARTRRKIGTSARRHVESNYSWPCVAQKFQTICEDTFETSIKLRN